MRRWVSGAAPGIADLVLGVGAPPAATETEMLVEVHAAALNFSDLLMIDGRYQVRPPRPFTPGQEVAGVVVVAPEGSGWRAGDRVASKVEWGGFAEFARVRTDMAIRLPDGIDFARAATLPVVYTTALVALSECTDVGPGQTVLVHAAAGGVGLASVEIAKARGARVIATAGGPEKLALAARHGADTGFDYRREDWMSRVMTATEGRGVDAIVDPVGGDVGEASLDCLARDGTLLIVGFASGRVPKLAAHRLLLQRATARGVNWSHDDDGPMLRRVTERLMALLAQGALDPVVNDGYALEDLPRALDDLAGRASVGKLVLRLRPPESDGDSGR